MPGIALFMMVRRAAPLRAAWAGLLAVLATAAVGVLGANVICPNDRPLHMLLWHVAPLMLFAAIGAALGTWLLRWDWKRAGAGRRMDRAGLRRALRLSSGTWRARASRAPPDTRLRPDPLSLVPERQRGSQ